ncbi:DUF222 domain-containing protein [Gordonia phthalatica]|uniref:DUF222 domain-containing protein n=1 Tax=Gordonia phthalatica TaxID=1136941 RepID=A0A0N9MP87_9ACTN|nr:DUF222 domain-containing protein [Gordonia phthalatica]ALG84597.1 hypothetical protein ACH46_08955 [Gordonia phthalatica]
MTTTMTTLTHRPASPTDDLSEVRAIVATARDESRLAWERFRLIYSLVQRRLATDSADGVDRDRLLVDTIGVVAAEVAVVLTVCRETGMRKVGLAIDANERLIQTARLLRDGVISERIFAAIAFQCAAVDDEDLIAAIDAEIAQELREFGAVSQGVAEDAARRFIAEYDPDGLREKRKANTPGVSIANDVDQSTLTIATSPEDVALMDKANRARAGQVCQHDSRAFGKRRADAFVAAQLGTPFGCDCGRPDCPADASAQEVDAQFAQIVVHVVADASTLNGSSDKAAYLDGFGVIDAHHAREIASRADALVRPLDLAGLADRTAQTADGHRPTAACDTAVRAVHGTCSTPGCNRAAWSCDLDHVTEYNHDSPAAGGATCPCNLNPKCRIHHLIKTFAEGWLDDQVVDANGVFWTETTTPSGYTVRAKARNHWLLPELGLIPCRHGEPVAPGVADSAAQPERSRTRLQAKHDYRMRLRSQRRYARECAAAAKADTAVLDSDGEPPF